MALIRNFIHRPDAPTTFRTEVTCGYTIGSARGERILHLETYGSKHRVIPDKVSQSLELDEARAGELLQIIGEAFPSLDRL